MKMLHLKTLVSLLLLSLLVTVGVAAQTPQPPISPLDLIVEALPTAPLVSQDVLAPGCELTSAEAGVFQVVCESDPGTSGIPTIDGELVAPGCELTNPEAGVFILDCETEPFEPVPMSPAPLTIQPGSIGDNPPLDRAPQPGVCDGAAESYLEPGMEVISTLLISLNSVVYNNQDEDLALYALHAFEANNIGSAARQQFTTPVNNELNPIGTPIQYGDILKVGSESTCVTFSQGTMRLWRLESSFGSEFGYWVIETIAFNDPMDLTSAWPENLPDPQNPNLQITQPQFPVLVDGVVFRYLMPYIEGPITTMPGANQIDTDLPQGYACEYAAPSFLSPGMDVILSGYGYEQMPDLASNPEWETWMFLDGQFPLSDHGMSTYVDILNSTPLLNIPGNFEAIALSSQELLDNGTTFTTGTIVNGPFCTEATFTPPEAECACTTFPCQPCTTGSGDPAPNRFYTWWEVDVTTNGQSHRGFYVENVGQYSHWLWATDGIFPRKLFLYYMIPFNAMVQPECPTPGLFAGQAVQPAAGAMNLRAAPNGDVIGRVAAGQPVNVFGDPTCAGGANWWQTDSGGFIAENDPANGLPLLVPYIPPVVTEEPAQPNPVVTAEPAQPNLVITAESPREPERPTEESPREPERPTEESPREPERPTQEPPPVIAPIIAQPVNPTTPPR